MLELKNVIIKLGLNSGSWKIVSQMTKGNSGRALRRPLKTGVSSIIAVIV